METCKFVRQNQSESIEIKFLGINYIPVPVY